MLLQSFWYEDCAITRGILSHLFIDLNRRESFQIFVIPAQVSFETILLITGDRDAVKLPRIDHQTSGYILRAQSLIHLLIVFCWYVKILSTRHDE